MWAALNNFWNKWLLPLVAAVAAAAVIVMRWLAYRAGRRSAEEDARRDAGERFREGADAAAKESKDSAEWSDEDVRQRIRDRDKIWRDR